MSEPGSLDQLCDAHGILARYRDHTGAIRQVPEATLRALLDRLGGTVPTGVLPPVTVHRLGRGAIVVPLHRQGGPFRWTLTGDDGSERTGSIAAASGRIVIEDAIAPGDYVLTLSCDGTAEAACPLIVAPAQAFLPPLLRDGGRLWGIATQLFALRSARNWGIGDFTDLADLAERAAANGAAAVGLTPLHALFPDQPDRCSPYSPNSRSFLNVLYLDPEAMPEFATCEAAQALRKDAAFGAALERLRSTPLVDYAGAARCKMRALEMLYEHFRDRHLAREDE
ncbi:MAG TPA: 4-alpha-glucanotransferase, partial [Dongiaceae bacterium]|nr:4-alpha-glucanotransferase [Dongiaceae bacterium]